MTTFEARDNLHKLYGLYEGYVTNNIDPLRAGRVKVCIPGLLEPESDWVMQVGAAGGGINERGQWFIPAVESNVAILFKEGEIDHPRYLTGPWPYPDAPETPTFARLSPAEAVQISGLQTKKWEIVLDDRAGSEQVRITHRDFPNNAITIDGAAQAVEVQGTVAVQIRSTGIINIEGLQVVINGRPVLPGAKPI